MNELEYQSHENFEDKEKRPIGLTVLAVLTFIGSGCCFLLFLYIYGIYNVFPQMLREMGEIMGNTMGETYRQTYEQTADMISNVSRSSFLLLTLPYLVSIVGAGFMLAMRKLGFHLYVIGQILALTLLPLVLKQGFPITGLFLSITFIGLYFMYYKKFR